MTQTRQPEGIPVGGQFAAASHAEPNLSLAGQPAFDAEAHAELTAAIRAETFRIDESKRKLSRMQLDAALSIVRKDFPDAAELELSFSSSSGMNAKSVRDKDGNILSEGTSWTFSTPDGSSYLVNHLDQTSQSLFYNGEDGFRFEDVTGALLVDVNHRFSPPAVEPAMSGGFDRGDQTPAADMSPEQVRTWIAGQALHHLSPVIGWMHLDAEDGNDTTVHNKSFEERVGRLAEDVAERFTVPAPVLDGFTAAEVEDHMAREQHDRQCACDLPGDVCRTESYGEHWRHRLGVPDVEGIFDTIQEMAAAR